MNLKQHLRLVLSLTALGVGALILFVSLSRSATSVMSSTGQYEASRRQLYMDSELLPDHVLYPVLMVIDRVKLEAATPTDRIYMQLEYGQRRTQYALELLEKDSPGLALSTATKAQKYFLHAVQASLEPEIPHSVQQRVRGSLEVQQLELARLKTAFDSDQDKAILDQLLSEGEALLERLPN